MKRSDIVFSTLLVPMDALMIVTAFVLAYTLRTQDPVIYILPFREYLQFVLSVLPILLLVFALEGLYTVGQSRKGVDEISGIFVGVSLGVLLVLAAIFLTDTRIGSRVVLLYAYLNSLIFVFLGRWVVRLVQRFLYQYGVGTHRVVIVGTNDRAMQLVREINRNPNLGYVYLGHVSVDQGVDPDSNLGKHLGRLADLEAVVDQCHPDELIVTESHLSDKAMLTLLALTNQKRIDLRLTPNLVGVQTAHVAFQTMAGIPVMEIKRTPLQGWGRVAKRVFDLITAVLCIVIFAPIMIATAIAVKLTSQGPVIYRNERVGQDKRHFWTYKFRSMRTEFSTGADYGGEKALQYEQELIAKQNTRKGATYKVGNDPRLTPIGAFLRKTSLDEFPQFFNVLFGHMSMVGPRPHQPREVAKYQPWQEKLFTIKPGITGLAQISGRSDLDFDDEARLDISYIERWSFWFDIKIILRTPLALLRSRQRKAA